MDNKSITTAQEKLSKALNYAINVDENGAWYTQLHGFKKEDFNRAGVPSVIKLSRLAEMTLDPIWDLVCDCSYSSESQQDQLLPTFFIIGLKWILTSHLNHHATANYPMTSRWAISRVGRTSIDVCQIFLADDERADVTNRSKTSNTNQRQRPVMACIMRVALVDQTTRKSVPLSQHLMRNASRHVVSGLVPGMDDQFPTLKPPTSAPSGGFKNTIRVRYEDMDDNFHVNHSSYILFAMECAAEAVSKRFYSGFVGDIAFYPVRQSQAIFLSEAVVGDELDVVTWQDVVDSKRLYFVVLKRGTTIFFAEIDFFDSIVTSSL